MVELIKFHPVKLPRRRGRRQEGKQCHHSCDAAESSERREWERNETDGSVGLITNTSALTYL